MEIVKRPGQTLGLYIREGNGGERNEGVFISRIALESPVYHSGCLHVSDEILAVNLVDVTRISLDDVVIIMSIPRRLVLTTRRRRGMATGPGGPGTSSGIGVSIFQIMRSDLRDFISSKGPYNLVFVLAATSQSFLLLGVDVRQRYIC